MAEYTFPHYPILLLFLILPSTIINIIGTGPVSTATAEVADSSGAACLHPRDRGDATSCSSSDGGVAATATRFYYDRATKHCQPFSYLGCGGNANRFESMAACKETCSGVVDSHGSDAHASSGQSVVLPVPLCEGKVRAAVDNETTLAVECSAESSCPAGHRCEKATGGSGTSTTKHCCPTREHTCGLEYDTGRYASQGHHTPRYFYNPVVKNCLLFTYYGALGNANNFATYNECIRFCGDSGAAAAGKGAVIGGAMNGTVNNE